MENLYIKIGLLFLAVVSIVWGGRIVFSDKYFTYWQNNFWQEKNGHQWSSESVKVNRWGAGFGALVFGIMVVYFVISQMY